MDTYGDTDFFNSIGGSETINMVVKSFYDRIEEDPELRPLFPKSLHHGRQMQRLFLEEWLGGRPVYSNRGAENGAIQGGMHGIHYHFTISKKNAGRWLHHMSNALKDSQISADNISKIMSILGPIANSMVNDGASFSDLLTALRLAGQGDITSIKNTMQKHPEIVRQRGTAGRTLLWESARNGNLEMTTFLIENGSDPNIPGGAPLLLKPYALALSRDFNKVADYLKSHGTEIDIFTACYTGDLQRIKYILGTSPELVNCLQAYEDVNSIVPLHYAIHGGEIETIEYLFSLKPNYKPYMSTLLSLARSMNREDIISLIQEI